jgi:ubiquinone/menaquinone biosynthesis C-methylase UbiE
VRIERERVTSSGRFPPWIKHEHLARYLFAAERAAGKVVVDCACGDGTCARLMAPRARHVYGFDLSDEAVSDARARTDRPNLSFTAADATALPLPKDTADLYVSLETIEHLPDQDAFLREVARVLKPEGEFICSTPDRAVYSPGNTLSSQPWNRFHLREYTQAEFTELLERYFERVELYGQNPKSPSLVAIRFAIGKRVPGHLVVRAVQAAKLPRYLHDRLEHHPVMPVTRGRCYELLTAICSGPLRATG